MMQPVRRNDEGFSLTELVVVVALLAFVIAAAYAALNAVQVSTAVSDRHATFAAEVGGPMLAIEEVLQQALTIESAGPYSITVTTDVDNNDLVERHIITAGTDGKLTHQAYNTNSLTQNTTARLNVVWSTNNVNRVDTVPLFYYYDENLEPITDYGLVSTDAQSMDMIVVVKKDGRTFRSSRTVVLRNL